MAPSAWPYFPGFVSLAMALSCASHAPAPTASHAPAPAASQAPQQVVAPTASSPQSKATTRPHLRVGTSGDYAPFSVRDAGGTVRGFDAEIAEALSRDLGFELDWVSFRWPTLQSQLHDGEFDVAMSGVTRQPARGVLGYLTRAVARGGPCVLGDEQAKRVAVNQGGGARSLGARPFRWSGARDGGSEPTALDLAQQIRPALNELGDRILLAVVEARGAGQLAQISLSDLEVLSPWLDDRERRQLLDSLQALNR